MGPRMSGSSWSPRPDEKVSASVAVGTPTSTSAGSSPTPLAPAGNAACRRCSVAVACPSMAGPTVAFTTAATLPASSWICCVRVIR
ncbi:unnamed protein product [Symbiodinium microadriaticum]|nr:unnamed protein product [Symbiodinium microadriaticum]